MNIQQLQPTRDQIWLSFWEIFFSKLSKNQRNSWGQRRDEMESFFKQAWDSGATTVLDLLNDAVQKRDQLIVSQRITRRGGEIQ